MVRPAQIRSSGCVVSGYQTLGVSLRALASSPCVPSPWLVGTQRFRSAKGLPSRIDRVEKSSLASGRFNSARRLPGAIQEHSKRLRRHANRL